MNEPWHAMTAQAALDRLGTAAASGLDGARAAARLAEHGPNTLPEPPPRPRWRIVARQFASPLVAILLGAAALAIAMGHLSDALVIGVVVLVNALVGAFQEGRAEASMAALRQLSALQVHVLRDGQERRVAARELVPGDLLLLAAGDAVGADARLVQVSQLQVAEAALTGESVPVAKIDTALPEATTLADRHNMVHAGTQVSAGRAQAVVVATGAHTELGRIAALTEGAQEPATPLERRLARFGRALVAAALALFIVVMALGLARGLPLTEVLMVAISQMVSMVPEGLPVAMTIALAVGMQRMAARGALVSRLAAVETLGSTTVICSDKTGTLTRNEMTVTAAWLPPADGRGGLALQVSGSGYQLQGTISAGGRPLQATDTQALHALLHAAVLCNDAQLQVAAGGAAARPLGDPTEAALLVLAAKAGLDPSALREAHPRDAEWPFDAGQALMATRHRSGAQAPRRVLLKGAPEAILRLCGDPAPVREAARAQADTMAAQALRTLALAEVADHELPADGNFQQLAGQARLLGLVGQIDPPREAAREAIAQCHAAGIRVLMLTGDHKLTGLAIARALGLAGADARALDGSELERLGEEELRDLLGEVAVFARVQPAQKLRIVAALQARGEVVAMTGDGVNDAPALARADVGVAMGITGTDVAKAAARIVVTDDNFATIVAAVEQGRVVYANLKKVILYLFATSIDEVVVLLAALLAGLPLPLAAVQILWINIVTEGTLTVNLVMDPPAGDEMRQPPVPRDDALLDRALLARVALMAAGAVGATFGWYAWRSGQGLPLELVRTETFTLLAMCQWFNVLNCQHRTRSALHHGLAGVWGNPWLAGGLALSVGLQLAVLYLPPLSALFYTQPLPLQTLATLLACASGVLWLEELRKWLARRRAG